MSLAAQLTLTNGDGQVLDVRARNGAELEVRLSRRDIAEERQQAAPERKGPGNAEVSMAAKNWSEQGECLNKGSRYQFDYTAQDGSVSITVQMQNANTTPVGSASFMTNAGGKYEQFSINFPMDNDNEPVVTASGDSFSVSGIFFSTSGGTLAAVDGSIAISCKF